MGDRIIDSNDVPGIGTITLFEYNPSPDNYLYYIDVESKIKQGSAANGHYGPYKDPCAAISDVREKVKGKIDTEKERLETMLSDNTLAIDFLRENTNMGLNTQGIKSLDGGLEK